MDNGESLYRRFRDGGDENALCEIIAAYKDALVFYLYSCCGNLTLAEDAAEDTFVHLGVKKPKDKRKAGFKTWLFAIGRNKMIDEIRRAKRRKESDPEEANEAEDPSSLEDEWIRDEEKKALHRAMRELKSEYRQVLHLVYFEDMTAKDAASVLKKSPHSVEMLLSRARLSLKNKLEKDGFER